MHQSDFGVKEHLLSRVNELEKVNMERSTELLFARKNVQGYIDERNLFEEKAVKTAKEYSEFKS